MVSKSAPSKAMYAAALLFERHFLARYNPYLIAEPQGGGARKALAAFRPQANFVKIRVNLLQEGRRNHARVGYWIRSA